MKQIQFTKGCPNQCKYCYEPKEMEYYDPKIPKGEALVQILDMNFLSNPKHEEHLTDLMEANNKEYELICGVDYRRLNQELCNLLYNARFIKMRWAWDYGFSDQKIHQKVWKMFLKAGYKSENLSVFMIANWKIPFTECCKKLDLLKVWNVKVNDCCFDGGYKNTKPIHWDIEDIKIFRKICRKHNQLVRFKLDPECKSRATIYNWDLKSPSAQLKLI